MGLCLKRSKLFTKQLDLNKSKPFTNWPGRNSGAFDAFSMKFLKQENSTVEKSQCLCYNDLCVLLHMLYSKKSKKLFKHSWLYCVHLWSLTFPNRPFTLKLASDTSAPPVSTMARRGQNLKWATDWALVGLIQLTRCCIGKKMWLVIFYTQKNMLLLHFLHLMCWPEEKHVTSFCVQSKLDQETHWENESENRKTLIVSGLYQGACPLLWRSGSDLWLGETLATPCAVSTDFRNVGTMTLQLCWNVGELCQGFAGLPKLEASDHSSVSFKGLPGHSLCTRQCEKLHSTKTVCLDKLGFFCALNVPFFR